jgi:hypothetical protein
MPLSNPFANRRIVEVVEGIRQHPDAAYGIAIGLVALATLTRWAMGDYIGGNVPFITLLSCDHHRCAPRRHLARRLRHHPVCTRGMVSVPAACL